MPLYITPFAVIPGEYSGIRNSADMSSTRK
jgi:hypothetical protein